MMCLPWYEEYGECEGSASADDYSAIADSARQGCALYEYECGNETHEDALLRCLLFNLSPPTPGLSSRLGHEL